MKNEYIDDTIQAFEKAYSCYLEDSETFSLGNFWEDFPAFPILQKDHENNSERYFRIRFNKILDGIDLERNESCFDGLYDIIALMVECYVKFDNDISFSYGDGETANINVILNDLKVMFQNGEDGEGHPFCSEDSENF